MSHGQNWRCELILQKMRSEFAELNGRFAVIESKIFSLENRLLVKQVSFMIAAFVLYSAAKEIFHF